MWIEKAKNRWKTDKRFRRSLCALFLAIGLAVTGISLAYFTSEDQVTNRIESDYHTPEITLSEPKWDKEGQIKAKEFVAGMEIEKDPYATSYMPSDVYLRMKITVYDSNGNEVTLKDGESLELVTYDSATAKSTNDYSAFWSAIYYEDAQLLKVKNEAVSSNNPYYYYNDGWFYYVEGSSLKALSYEETTEVPLFTEVMLPVFDNEYDVFSVGFRIRVTAEAVNVAKFTSTDTGEIDSIADVFGAGDDNNTNMSMKCYDDDALVNEFMPGTVSIAVKENDTLYPTGEKQLPWTLDEDENTDTAEKKVQIHCNDDTGVTSCYVRLCFVPEWIAEVKDTTESKTVEVLGDDGESSITFPATITGNTFTIDGITFTLAEDWSENWIYQNGYFYYKKILSPGEDTKQLLESVSVAADDLTVHTNNGEYLGISVLTDAVQAEGEAVVAKWKVMLAEDSGAIQEVGSDA